MVPPHLRGTIYRYQGKYESLMTDLVASNLRLRHNAHGGETSATTIYGEYFGHEVPHIYMYIYARNRCARTPPLRRVRLNHTTFATVNPQGLLQWLHTIKTAYTVTQAPRTSSFAGASDFVFCEYEVGSTALSIHHI